MPPEPTAKTVTGRCYCGACFVSASCVQTVSYCHCIDCRRWTGAPVAAFAAVTAGNFTVPDAAKLFDTGHGVTRWTCGECGSPLACRFDYLPDQIYLPLGILDQAEQLPPQLHSHEDNRLSWLHITDELPRERGSARASLNSITPAQQ